MANVPERIELNGGWYIDYPVGYSKGDPREGEFWLFDKNGVGKFVVAFEEWSALEFAAAMTQPVAVSPTAEELAEAKESAEFNYKVTDIVFHHIANLDLIQDGDIGPEDDHSPQSAAQVYIKVIDRLRETQLSALDAKLLEGVRLGLGEAFNLCFPLSQSLHEVSQNIRALQPETIVKGDK